MFKKGNASDSVRMTDEDELQERLKQATDLPSVKKCIADIDHIRPCGEVYSLDLDTGIETVSDRYCQCGCTADEERCTDSLALPFDLGDFPGPEHPGWDRLLRALVHH